jgi:ribosomal protein S4
MVTKCLRETSNGRERELEKRERATEKEKDSIYREERRKKRELTVLRGASVRKKFFLDCFTENRAVKQLTVK